MEHDANIIAKKRTLNKCPFLIAYYNEKPLRSRTPKRFRKGMKSCTPITVTS